MSEKDEIISQLVKCLDLDELLESLARKSMIVDSQIEALRSIHNEMLSILGEMRQELIQFRRDRQICGRLNLLMDAQIPPEQPKKKPKIQQKTHRNREYGKVTINYKSTGY